MIPPAPEIYVVFVKPLFAYSRVTVIFCTQSFPLRKYITYGSTNSRTVLTYKIPQHFLSAVKTQSTVYANQYKRLYKYSMLTNTAKQKKRKARSLIKECLQHNILNTSQCACAGLERCQRLKVRPCA